MVCHGMCDLINNSWKLSYISPHVTSLLRMCMYFLWSLYRKKVFTSHENEMMIIVLQNLYHFQSTFKLCHVVIMVNLNFTSTNVSVLIIEFVLHAYVHINIKWSVLLCTFVCIYICGSFRNFWNRNKYSNIAVSRLEPACAFWDITSYTELVE